jgi:tRNA1(Val) A37 N6-methylase TrmN6
MEQLFGGYTLDTPPGTFPLSTDSMVLSGFVKLKRGARVLDLGSGCGTLGLLLCAKDATCHVTGIELDAAAHSAALDNIARNGLDARLESICADLRDVAVLFPQGRFDVCISNPPYFSGGPASATVPTARREDLCSTEDLLRSAGRALKYGGDLFLVHRPERLGELCAKAAQFQLEAKRLCLVRHRPADPVSLILLQCRKGAKPGLAWEELILFESDGTPTPAYRTLYHL